MDSKHILQALRQKHGKTAYMYVQEKYVFGEESDFLTISYKDYTHEYEVKVTKADFKADFKKSKHKMIPKIIGGDFMTKRYEKEYDQRPRVPNRFSFVVPEGLIKPDELPSYAGLYYVDDEGDITCAKKSKTIHKQPFTKWRYLANKFFHHYEKLARKRGKTIHEN